MAHPLPGPNMRPVLFRIVPATFRRRSIYKPIKIKPGRARVSGQRRAGQVAHAGDVPAYDGRGVGAFSLPYAVSCCVSCMGRDHESRQRFALKVGQVEVFAEGGGAVRAYSVAGRVSAGEAERGVRDVLETVTAMDDVEIEDTAHPVVDEHQILPVEIGVHPSLWELIHNLKGEVSHQTCPPAVKERQLVGHLAISEHDLTRNRRPVRGHKLTERSGLIDRPAKELDDPEQQVRLPLRRRKVSIKPSSWPSAATASANRSYSFEPPRSAVRANPRNIPQHQRTTGSRHAHRMAQSRAATPAHASQPRPQGARVLGAFLHAAALGRSGGGDGRSYDMPDVQAWVADPETGQKMVTKLLLRSPDRSFSANPPSTSPSTTRPRPPSRRPSCPRWPGCRTRPRSPRRRPRRPTSTASSTTRATVYLLASKEHEAIVPLVTALVSYLARAAGRRLEPPLTLALDETYVTCPIPLDEWSSDMGGFNIQIVYVVQSPSQLRERYGESTPQRRDLADLATRRRRPRHAACQRRSPAPQQAASQTVPCRSRGHIHLRDEPYFGGHAAHRCPPSERDVLPTGYSSVTLRGGSLGSVWQVGVSPASSAAPSQHQPAHKWRTDSHKMLVGAGDSWTPDAARRFRRSGGVLTGGGRSRIRTWVG